MKRDWIAYVMLPLGIVGLFVGVHMVSGGDALGWAPIGGGLVAAAIAYLVMRPAPSEATVASPEKPTDA